MKNEPVQMTQNGCDSLKKELEVLVKAKRPEIVERLSNARAEGDLKENSDYHNAKSDLEFMDGKIEELEHVIKNAVVAKSAAAGSVGVGTSVTIEANGAENTFEIVGEWEADPMKKKISHTSPLGQALVGKKKGETVEVEAPAGKISYKILFVK